MDGLFEGVENEPGMRGGADAPADNLSGTSDDDPSVVEGAARRGGRHL